MEGLGIDFKLLVVQVVNFLILLFILKRWVYKPFIKFLDNRAEKVHESLEASEKIKKELKELENIKEKELTDLKEKSQSILNNVHREALEEKKTILLRTAEEAKLIIESAKGQIESERKQAFKDIQKEVSALALEISKKIFSELDEEKARSLINESLKEDSLKK